MDLDQIKHLNAEQKTSFAKLERLFNEPGWEIIVEIATLRARQAEGRILNATSWDQALLHRGMRSVYAEIANLREVTEAEFAALAAAQAEATQFEEESKYE